MIAASSRIRELYFCSLKFLIACFPATHFLCSMEKLSLSESFSYKIFLSKYVYANTFRIIIEQSVEFNSKRYFLFIDFVKAFDSKNRNYICLALRAWGITEKLISLMLHSSDPFSGKIFISSEMYSVISAIPHVLMQDVLSSIENKSQEMQWQLKCRYLAFADVIFWLSHRLCDLKQSTDDLHMWSSK